MKSQKIVSSQDGMEDDSFHILEHAYYIPGLVSMDAKKDAAEASREFSNAMKHLEGSSGNPQIKYLLQ